MLKTNTYVLWLFELEMEKDCLTNENIILRFGVKFSINTIPIKLGNKISQYVCNHD